jgi:hypothetical protein
LPGAHIPRGRLVATTGGARGANLGIGNTINFDLEPYGGSPEARSSVEFTIDDCGRGGMDDARRWNIRPAE